MKKILTPVLALLSFATYAQITIDLSDFAIIGDEVKVAQDTLPATGILPGSAGANQNWNFHDLAVHYNSINPFKDPAVQPNAAFFPGADIVYSSIGLDAYIKATSSELTLLGADGDIVGAGVSVIVPFQDPQKILNFPAQYGDAFLDTTHFLGTFKATDLDPTFTFFDSVRISHWAYASNDLDAWGSMIIPGDTLDVLRKKRVEYTRDSVWVKAGGLWQFAPPVPPFLASNPRLDTLRTYDWFAKNEKYILVTMDVDANDLPQSVSYIYKGNMAVTLSADHLNCDGANDGSLGVNFSVVGPGVPPYTYLWSNGSTAASIAGLSAGTYSVTVTDNLGDIAIATGTITEPSAITATPTIVDAHCSSCPNGSIALAVTGGTPGYTYDWNNGGALSDIDDLLPGDYTVTITDLNGCEEISTITVGFWSVSVEENMNTEQAFVVYPNPAQDRVFVKNAKHVTLYDILGHKVAETTMGIPLNVSKLSPGIYIISAQIEGKTYSQKLSIR